MQLAVRDAVAARPASSVLVNMPWYYHNRPSLACGLLKAFLARAGRECDVLYPNVWLAREFTFRNYDIISSGGIWKYLGEWLFARAAFRDEMTHLAARDMPWAKYGSVQKLHSAFGKDFHATLEDVRERLVPDLCNKVARACEGRRFVGFTCSIYQLLPALAAARSIKERDPKTTIVLGGSQLEDEMGDEVLRICPWIDAIYKGEAELGLLETVSWAHGETQEPPREYVSFRRPDGTLSQGSGHAMFKDLDSLPVPDYDDYFRPEVLEKDVAGAEITVSGLMFESARGCWWGEIQHCTFCGLNGSNMAFRQKSADRLIDEMLHLSDRYQQLTLFASDNIISHDYLKTMLPRLKDLGIDLELFYETKANLRRDHIELYRDAGIRMMQPGIESLSSRVLKLMRKGISAIQNVYCLKLSQEYDISAHWNILMGFPGETAADYEEQLALLPRLYHLSAPEGATPFVLQRFSPMHFDAASFGIRNVKEGNAYRHLFPPDRADLLKLAFYFGYKHDGPSMVEHQKRMIDACLEWKRRWMEGDLPSLHYHNLRDFMVVVDRRGFGEPKKFVLNGIDRDVVLATRDLVTLTELEQRFAGRVEEMHRSLDELDQLGILMREGRKVLGLALPNSKRKRLIVRHVRDHGKQRRPAAANSDDVLECVLEDCTEDAVAAGPSE